MRKVETIFTLKVWKETCSHLDALHWVSFEQIQHGKIISFKPISNNAAVGRTTFRLVQDVCLSYMHTTEMHPFLGLLSTLVVCVLWEFWEPSVPWTVGNRPIQSYAWVFWVSSGHMFFVVKCLHILIRIQHEYWETLSICSALGKKHFNQLHLYYSKNTMFSVLGRDLEENISSKKSPHVFRTIKNCHPLGPLATMKA